MLVFNVKNIIPDRERVTVKVPATVDGKPIFETCYPWQATFLVTLWMYYCVAFEATQYLEFTGQKSIAQEFNILSTMFYQKFIQVVHGTPDGEALCSQCCQVLVLDNNTKDWQELNRSVVLQLRKIAASMADFMEANKMDTHAVKDAQYNLNNI